jgi:hypothetical protein
LSDPIPSASIPPDTSSRSRLRTPYEYYASPETKRPIFPRGLGLGCGIASVLFLLVIFIGGAVVARNGLGRFMDPLLGMMADEMDPMYTKDVTPADRKALADEITRLRENVRSGKVPVARLQTVMTSLREAISDQRITPDEAQSLTKQIHETNTTPPAQKRHP